MPKKPRKPSVRPPILITDPADAWAKLKRELQMAGALFETDPDDGKIKALAAVIGYLLNRGLGDAARRPVVEILHDLKDKGQKLTTKAKRLRAEVAAVHDALMTLDWLEQPAAEAVAAVLAKVGVQLGGKDPEVKLWESVRNLRTKLLAGRGDRIEAVWFNHERHLHVTVPMDDGVDRAAFLLQRLEERLPGLKT